MRNSSTVERAECVKCGATFKRGHRQRWKALCLPCWKWQRVATLTAQTSRLLRGL